MSSAERRFEPVAVVEEEIDLTLRQLCRACCVEEAVVVVWVFEGVLEPAGSSPRDWRFGGESLRRTRQASRLWRDLKINPAGVALALDLLDEIALLRVRLQRAKLR